ncbi:glycoside hydrolase [Mycena rosella]|uniref:Glycoside hydrolase n=1 Tax=Mycena rosella TaxID=1033263 RepID=A0AAD7MAR9_MYCRO|nr:glycoside hydrolase [Mycena rosella]
MMVHFRLTGLAAIAPILLYLGSSTTAAVVSTGVGGTNSSSISDGRTNFSLPHFLAYSDRDTPGTIGPPAVSDIKGFNVFALSFLLQNANPADKAQEWTSLTQNQRQTIKREYAAAGIKLIVSAFGSTDIPTKSDPIAMGTKMANWVKQYDLDGMDVDYEDFDVFDSGTGAGENWLISFTTQLRTILPQGEYIITHAPVAPWFAPGGIWGGGGYLRVHKTVGDLIDWYNIQFYNQGAKEYNTCSNVLAQSSTQWPQTALFQIAANGVPLEKLVLGKPATNTSASDGFIPPTTLAGCLATAKSGGWSAGVSVWEYPDADATWIKTVRASSWAV